MNTSTSINCLKGLLTAWLLILGLATAQAQAPPTDNPYRTRYGAEANFPPAPYHWTDSLPWQRVFNIKDFATANRRVPIGLDSVISWNGAFSAARQAATSAGGGIIFFPKLPQRIADAFFDSDSAYYFNQSLRIGANIVLRGDNPSSAQANAKTRDFILPSFLEFPKYDYVSGRLRGGTPNSTSFKEIVLDTTLYGPGVNLSNIGVVNLDINRAGISFYPSWRDYNGGGGNTKVPNEKIKNVLIMGVRSNNAAIADDYTGPATGSNGTSRASWRFYANVLLFTAGNTVIANCRLNDFQNNSNINRTIFDDSFDQPDFQVRQGTNCITAGNQAKFSYTAHYGIMLNRVKRYGLNTVYGFLSRVDNPAYEPSHFVRGNVVRDNYIYKTARAAVHAAGLGLVVKGNIMRDDSTKQTYLDPTGRQCNTSNTSPSTDVAGIDITGWNALIEYNDIEFYRTKQAATVGDNYTGDGSGIYGQGASGTSFKNIVIRHNVIRTNTKGLCTALGNGQGKGFSGFVNVPLIENVLVDSNDFGGTPFYIIANDGAPGVVSGVTVSNNIQVRGVQLNGTAGGTPSRIYNNTIATGFLLGGNCINGTNGNIIIRSCQVLTGAPGSQPGANDNPGFSLVPANCLPIQITICQEPAQTNYPNASFATPTASIVNLLYNVSTSQSVPFSVNAGLIAGCSTDSVIYFINAVRAGQATFDNFLNVWNFSISYPANLTGSFTDIITAVVYKTTDQSTVASSTTSRTIQVILTTNRSRQSFAGQVQASPVPFSSKLQVAITSERHGDLQIRLLDMTGRTLQTSTHTKQGGILRLALSTANLPTGTYLLEVSDKTGRSVSRVVKN